MAAPNNNVDPTNTTNEEETSKPLMKIQNTNIVKEPEEEVDWETTIYGGGSFYRSYSFEEWYSQAN